MSKGKILITGAAGFIGSHLVEYLIADGEPLDRLRLFIPKGTSLENLPNRTFDIVWGDVRSKEDVRHAMDGVDYVFHLAAKTVFEGKTYKDFKDTNVDGTQNLLDECKNQKIRKFVFFSSIAVFGLPAFVGDIINVDESYPKRPAESYGRSKWEAEKRIVRAYKKYGVPYAIVRPTTVYGPRDKSNMAQLYKAVQNGYFFFIGNGENKMDYVYVEDLVKGARQAQLSRLNRGDYILGGGRPISLKQVVSSVAASLGKSVPRLYVPKWFGLLLSYCVDFTCGIFGIRPPLFPDRVRVMTTDCYFNIERARRKIYYNPQVSFSSGISKTSRWLVKNRMP